jgi:hypothetical protein
VTGPWFAALQRIAEDADCVTNMAGGCVGATRRRLVRRGNPDEYREVVNCPKHFAQRVLSESANSQERPS